LGNAPRIAPPYPHGLQIASVWRVFFVAINFVLDRSHKLKTLYGCNYLKPRYIIVLVVDINLIIYYGCPPSTRMDAILATIFDGEQAIHQKHE
jgi:hypothetical protein